MHRYQLEPPNVNCDDLVEFYDEYLKDLAFTEWLEVGDLFAWKEKKFDVDNISRRGFYVCFCEYE